VPSAAGLSLRPSRIWLFDLDDTLHDAHRSAMPQLAQAMGEFIERELCIDKPQSDALRRRYFQRYGATLPGLVRHHGIEAAHFLRDTHRLPGLEARLHCHPHDRAALAALPGRKYVLTNAPRAYALRVLGALGLLSLFDGIFAIEDMAMFGHLRPKPDARMLRRIAARLGVPPARCVLVEDTLAHQKSARRVGMGTVWMLRWVRRRSARGRDHTRQPAYVDGRVRTLGELGRRWA
jgi:putative hydrolase of the HAD superfamily